MNIQEYVKSKKNDLKTLIKTVKNDLNTIQSLTELNNSNNYDSYVKIENKLKDEKTFCVCLSCFTVYFLLHYADPCRQLCNGARK